MIKFLSATALLLASTAAFAQTTSADLSAQPDATPVAVAATVDIGAFDLDRDGGLNAIEYAQWWASTQAPAGGAPIADLRVDMSNRADDGDGELLFLKVERHGVTLPPTPSGFYRLNISPKKTINPESTRTSGARTHASVGSTIYYLGLTTNFKLLQPYHRGATSP